MNKPQSTTFDPSELLGFVTSFGSHELVRNLAKSYMCLSYAAIVAMESDNNVCPEEVADSLWYLSHLVYCIEQGIRPER